MSFFKVLVALQLSMFFITVLTSTVSSVDVDHLVGGGRSRKPLRPFPPPVAAPAMAPVSVPVPSKLPIRRPVAVQGVVFCKSCKYIKENTLQDASPLIGAVVMMVCYNGKRSQHPIVMTATTDKKGYFLIRPTKKVKVTNYGAQTRCRVFLASPPKGSNCKLPTNLHAGLSGAYLKPTKPATPVDFALYTVGPFAFAPIPSACPK